MQVDPDKLDELATEFKRFSNLIEDQETGLHKEITELIRETNAEYPESYVRAQTREMEDILREIRQLAAEVTEELNEKAQVMKNAADRFSQEEAETAKMLQQEVGFALTKSLKAVCAYYNIVPLGVAYVLEEILDFILGKSRNKYHESSINLPLEIEPLEASLTINPKVYNEQVKKLQQRLNELGYKIDIDGYFDEQTLAAVNAYKNKLGLLNQAEDAGVVEQQTWLCLFGGLTGELKLKPEKYSELVRLAQIRLKELGYQIEPTGYFDEKMLKVVNEFKIANRLGNSGAWAGVIGKQTWEVLFSPAELVVKPAGTPSVITKPSVVNTVASNSLSRSKTVLRAWEPYPIPEGGYGLITVNGKEMPIYVPKYANGSNANFEEDGWRNIDKECIRESATDFDYYGFFSSLNFEEDNSVDIRLNDRVDINKKNGITNVGSTKGIYQHPAGAFLVLLNLANTFADNRIKYTVSVAVQQKGDRYRAIIQLESNKNFMQENAGESFYKLEAGQVAVPNRLLFVKALQSILTDMGYGDCIEGDKYTNIYATLDQAHESDSSFGYLGYNDGKFILIPKIYEKDDICIVNNTTSWGFFTGHEHRISLRRELIKPIDLSDFIDVSIINDALEGKAEFN